jgi:hypothetical protein
MPYGGIKKAWIAGAVRTPVGRHGGALSTVRSDDLGAFALEALMERSGVPPSEIWSWGAGASPRRSNFGGRRPSLPKKQFEDAQRPRVASTYSSTTSASSAGLSRCLSPRVYGDGGDRPHTRRLRTEPGYGRPYPSWAEGQTSGHYGCRSVPSFGRPLIYTRRHTARRRQRPKRRIRGH